MQDAPLLVLCGLFGLIAAYFWREARQLRLRLDSAERRAAEAALQAAQAPTLLAERDAARAQEAEARREAQSARETLAALRAGEAARAQAATEREQLLATQRGELERAFAALASDALSRNEQRFLALANETFEKHRTAAQGQVKETVDPVRETFEKLAASVAALDRARHEDRATLSEQMRAVAEQLKLAEGTTGKLVNALRAAPKTRGRWGEETLRNVLQLAGLSQHADFTEQGTVDGEAGKLRPDVTIHLPGERTLVVDSKVALSAYLDAFEATDDQAREVLLKKHAAQLREHVRLLASKKYQEAVPASVDFVVLFVPGENFYAAAAERDPEIFEYALASNVMITTPVTLIALAKAVAYGWRQEEAARNAKLVAELGRELYKRLATFGDKLAQVGRSLGQGVDRYNELVGSLERSVMPQARKLRELGAGDPEREITEVRQIEEFPRALAPNRDLLLERAPILRATDAASPVADAEGDESRQRAG